MTKVFLVDDHEIVRRGIAELIDRETDLEVVGEAGTARDAPGRVAATSPDVVILDVNLPDGNGIDLCRNIRSDHPTLPCLILTAYDDDEALLSAVIAGAAGYVLKDIRGQGLVEAIRRVAAGRTLLSADVQERVGLRLSQTVDRRRRDDSVEDLTLRERQVLDLIAQGMTNRQIGEQLGLAEKTIKNYVSELLAKLGMERRTQAAVYGAARRTDTPRG